MRPSIGNRITHIGAGNVGIAYGYALVSKVITDHLTIIDIGHDKLVGEAMAPITASPGRPPPPSPPRAPMPPAPTRP